MNKIKAAFQNDVNSLIEGFARHGKTDFAIFCIEWKKRKFQHIYSALVNDGEIICATTDFLLVIKEVLISYQPFLERLGALYLIYALYHKQPTHEYCKIKVTRDDWTRIMDLVNSFDERKAEQAKLIFWKLVESCAFRFVVLDVEHGCDIHTHHAQRHFSAKPYTKIQTILHKDIMSLQHETNGLLPALDVLEGGYNEMKEIMEKDLDRNYQVLGKTAIFKDINKHINNLKKIMEDPEKTSETVDESQNENDIYLRRQRLKNKAIQKRYNSRINKKDENAEKEDFHDPEKASQTIDEYDESYESGESVEFDEFGKSEADIHLRRQHLKNKAKKKRYNSRSRKTYNNTEDEDFHVSMKGDFIEIRNERKTAGTLLKMPIGSDIFAESLPRETLDELEKPN